MFASTGLRRPIRQYSKSGWSRTNRGFRFALILVALLVAADRQACGQFTLPPDQSGRIPRQGEAGPTFGQVAYQVAYQVSDQASDDGVAKGTQATAATGIRFDDLNDEASVEKAVASLEASESIDDPLRSRLLRPLGAALQAWRNRSTQETKAKDIDAAIADVPGDLSVAETELAKPTPAVEPPNLSLMSTTRLRAGKAEREAEVESIRQDLDEIRDAIQQQSVRRAALPKLISETKQTIEALDTQTIDEDPDDQGGWVATARRAELTAKQAEAKQTLSTLEKELRLIESAAELLPKQEALRARDLKRAEALQQLWAEAMARREETIIESELLRYRTELAKSDQVDQSLILSLQDRWLELVGENERTARRVAIERERAAEYSRLLVVKSNTIEQARGSGTRIQEGLAYELQRLRERLPAPASIGRRIGDVADQIDELRREKNQLERIVNSEVDGVGGLIDRDEAKRLPLLDGRIHPDEKRLLGDYVSDFEKRINLLVDLQRKLDDQRNTILALRSLIDRHVMWIRDRPPFGFDELAMAWTSVPKVLHPAVLRECYRQAVLGLVQRYALLAILIFSLIAWIFFSSRLRRRLKKLADRARTIGLLSLRPTLAAIVVTLGLTLPPILILWVIGEAMATTSRDDVLLAGFAAAFTMAGWAIFPLELLRQLMRPKGLAESHFGAMPDTLIPLRRAVRWLTQAGLAPLILWRVTQNLSRSQIDSSLGRIAWAIGMIIVAVAIWTAMHPRRGVLARVISKHPDGWLARTSALWFWGLIAIPLTLIIVSLSGYTYAARVIAERFYGTFWLFLASYLTYGVIWRWTLMQRRRLAMAVHRDKAERAERLEIGGVEVEPEKAIEAAEISAQTSRLIYTLIASVALYGLTVVWAPVLPAVDFLDSIHLWKVTVETDANGNPIETEWVTLANLIWTVPILVIAIVAVRNLPGLIEGVLLERLPIDKAARYAITALATYAIAALGIVYGAQTLGLRWASIQWLVAALGVGLGFGLQEIFANFVSGLILLFEQPIRVGDVVTLGDTTGVVSRIRIRATTITNWDRQELVIPNKDLITGRLINWTLSDSTNRIVVNVGVAYGSDTERACATLREICEQHPAILDDPGPVITFEGFGDSTLNLVLRCYLTSLDGRLQTTHELHTMINNRFNAEGIEIAFPQRDIHLRTVPESKSLDRFSVDGEIVSGTER